MRTRYLHLFSLGLLLAPAVCAQTHGGGNAPTGLQRHIPPQPDGLYRLNPGDAVSISFRFTPEFNEDATVGPDGRAMLKSAGEVQLQGLTLQEVQKEIAEHSTAHLVNPEVTVSLKEFDRPHVIIAGEVAMPGRQDLRTPVTVMQAILAAGGPKEVAAMNRVVLFRRITSDTSEVHILKLGRYDRRTRAANDMLLQPDDLILVGHDHLETLGRFVKTVQLGMYLPLTAAPIY